MPNNTNEQALEAFIEKSFTGHCLEELKSAGETVAQVNENGALYGELKGYYMGAPKDYDATFAIDKTRFWDFLETTQAEELKKLQIASDWQRKILERLDRLIKRNGVLEVLRKGFSVDNAHFTLFYQLPNALSSDLAKKHFRQNQFSITRQVCYSLEHPGQEVDMVVFVNGLAIASLELKNPWTGQTARVDGQKQYKQDRDPKQTLFQFKRALVHFTADTEEVYMTTKVNGDKTFFLPFNKGNNNGKGNPVNSNGYKTAYLWDEVLQKESLAGIIQHFVTLEKDKDGKESLIFPRYHQLDVVRKLIADVTANGVGKSYLVQHSAGSGKSNSITWAAFQLIEVYQKMSNGDYDTQPLFDSVLVVTDRRVLDKQTKDNMALFTAVKGIVANASKSSELLDALNNGKKIITTTIQKFPFILDGIESMSDHRFAIIIDEAHSSQGGIAADKMNQALGNTDTDEDEMDWQDLMLQSMSQRKMRGNASYFAFTATPKATTLERFGAQQADGSFVPFHLYSMKQAIEEGFILDVLANYTTYKSYYEIAKSIEDNPLFDTAKAQKKLKAFVEKHPSTIATKAEIMLDHFIKQVYGKKKLFGHAKGMVVTQSIESAIRYYQSMQKLLVDRGVPFQILIAFSGKKTVDGIEYTEASMNGFPDTETKEQLKEDKYRLLVVANKYLTGFDQKLLTTMYVDKKLQGVLCVQALSRLNRSYPSMGKRTEDLFVLDFFNDTKEIKDSFDPFYTATSLSSATDVNILHDLQAELAERGVFTADEVETFNALYFKGATGNDLSVSIDTAANRFNEGLEWENEQKADFKIKAKQFVKIYGQMAALLPYEMPEWEKLYWFLKFLVPKLIVKDPQDDLIDELLNSVDLSTYALERTQLNVKIDLDPEDSDVDPQNPNPRGAHGGTTDESELDTIIEDFNNRWFAGIEGASEKNKDLIVKLREDLMKSDVVKEKYTNNPDPYTKKDAFDKIINDWINQQRRVATDFYKKYVQDENFKTSLNNTMRNEVDRSVRGREM